MPKISYKDANCTFVEVGDKKFCFSYMSCVAMIEPGVNGMEYTEFNGPGYYSATSNKHKAKFRAKYGISDKKSKK